MNTQNLPEDPSPTTATTSTTATTRREAQEVGTTGVEAAQHVASVAKDEAQNVAQEVGTQAQSLVAEFGNDLRAQAAVQQQKVAEGLRSISDELRSMAEKNSQEAGTATHWVHEASRRAGDAASWLDQRDPGSLLDDVKGFARRRPGAFLAIAAGAGLLAGRLTRGLTAGASEGSSTRDNRRLTEPPGEAVPRKVPPTPDYQLARAGGIRVPVTGQSPSHLDVETGESYGAGAYESRAPGSAGTGAAPVIGTGPVPENVYPPAPPEYPPEAGRAGTEDETEERLP